MVKISIPKGLPECKLLSILAEKASQRKDITFDFFGNLNSFRQRVSDEVRYINTLFPEFTPHDETYHLTGLFHIADKILGETRLETLNSAELFVLACSLYAHDWGMAVSESEKIFIVEGESSADSTGYAHTLLADESTRFSRFLRDQSLKIHNGKAADLPMEAWREYVRQTHASRSGVRAMRHFESIEGGIADAVSRVCMGHWLPVEDLTDHSSYPTDFSVLSETANLRALAVYLRLIDLFDIAEDRTPFVIWKYVAPRDPRSKMEWQKHRALRPITCPPYQDGRIIKVDGSTNDHEVYAALEDLRDYCDVQLRECVDALARMNDPRHRLDIFYIQWRINPVGFEPIKIRFEFDRERMFEILSDEIYQGDPYVFLRELLQNSIDAIRVRREILKRRKVIPSEVGVISVNVDHRDNGDAIITWKDDGIGMDEYVIKNYLAIAGRSYYHSHEFEKEGLNVDPISKFGVGILSCFMVCDRLEITTFKDPYWPPASKPLRIVIPDVRRQFRVEVFPEETAEVGTTVRVFVEGKKLPLDESSGTSAKLDVTQYISIISGFIEYPILIAESDRKTMILHPQADESNYRARFGSDYQVHKLSLDYPIRKVFLPQDYSTARRVFRENSCDLSLDLGLKGYEGVFASCKPIDDESDFEFSPPNELRVAAGSFPELQAIPMRWPTSWDDLDGPKAKAICRSAAHADSFMVFRDGILLSDASSPWERSKSIYRFGTMPLPLLIVNLPKDPSARIDLARTRLISNEKKWYAPIHKAYLTSTFDNHIKQVLQLKPDIRWYKLAELFAFNHLKAVALWDIMPADKWIFPYLESDARLHTEDWGDRDRNQIYSVPRVLRAELVKLILSKLKAQIEYKGLLNHWEGDPAHVSNMFGHESVTIMGNMMMELTNVPLERGLFDVCQIRFLTPPSTDLPPLVQEVYEPIKDVTDWETLTNHIRKVFDSSGKISATDATRINFFLEKSAGYGPKPKAAGFPPPFADYFGYSFRYINTNHPVGRMFLRCYVTALLASEEDELSEELLGTLHDALDYYPMFRANYERSCAAIRRLLDSLTKCKLLDIESIEELIPKKADFVPGTCPNSKDGWEDLDYRLQARIDKLELPRPFGSVCK